MPSLALQHIHAVCRGARWRDGLHAQAAMAQLHLLQQLVAQASAGLPAQPPPVPLAPAAVPASSALCSSACA